MASLGRRTGSGKANEAIFREWRHTSDPAGIIQVATREKRCHGYSACQGGCDHDGDSRLGLTDTAPRLVKDGGSALPVPHPWGRTGEESDAKRLWRSARGTAWAACSAIGRPTTEKGRETQGGGCGEWPGIITQKESDIAFN